MSGLGVYKVRTYEDLSSYKDNRPMDNPKISRCPFSLSIIHSALTCSLSHSLQSFFMQSSTKLTSTHCTCMSNVTKHPGLPDAPAKQQPHAKKLAAEAEQSELQAIQQMKA